MPLPDVEVLLKEWARADADISAIVSSRVGTRLPKDPTMPYLTVFRVGGQPQGTEGASVDEALVQWDCYGPAKTRVPDYATASLLARTVVEKAEGSGTYNGTGGSILAMRVVNGPRRQDEPATGWARYIVDMLVMTVETP